MLYRLSHLNHGLGDAVMLTAILAHLRHYRPQVRLELICEPGREALYEVRHQVSGVRHQEYDASVDAIYTAGRDAPPATHKVDWPAPIKSYAGIPSTWSERFLLENLRLRPIESLCRSRVPVDPDKRRRVRQWLEMSANSSSPSTVYRLPPTCLCHFAGVSFKDKKDLDARQQAAVAGTLAALGYRVLLWDLNDRSPLAAERLAARVPPGPPLFPSLPRGNVPSSPQLDVGILAALIAEVDLFVGVDSGPLHLAGAIGTPAIGLFPRQAPVHCIHPDQTTTHLVLKNGRREYERFLVHRPAEAAIEYQREHYRVIWCDDFAETLAEVLTASPRPRVAASVERQEAPCVL